MPGFTPTNRSVTPAVRRVATRLSRFIPGNGLRRIGGGAQRQSARTYSSASVNGAPQAVAPLRGRGTR